MFFPRLRNQAKWAFVFLILVFGGGFIFLGVGSGGLDLGQLLRDAFGNQGASTGSVSDAQDAVRERPFNAPARRKLAETLEQKGRTDEAIAAWSEFVRLRPRDFAARRHLGDLQLSQADRYLNEARLAAFLQAEANAGQTFGPSQSDAFGRAVGKDPIGSAVGTKYNAQLQEASTKYQTAATQAVNTYKAIVKLQPNDQQALFSLAQAADTLQQTQVAINAYTRLLDLDLDEATKGQIRARIKTLRQSLAPQG
jgi:tetratricopeptide (TPR) repeat protein